MRPYPGQFLAVLILAIVVNFAAASVHAATHLSADAVDCEMCSGFFDAGDSVVADRHGHLPILGQPLRNIVAPPQAGDAIVISAYPRGPPD